MDDCILSSLSLPPGTKPVMNATSCSPAGERVDASFNTSRRSSEAAGQRLKETRDSWQLQVRGGNISQERKAPSAISARPCDETIDLTAPNETADTDSTADDNSQSVTGVRVLRKRKLSGGVEVPSKQPAEAAPFL